MLTFIATYELIQLIVYKNNLHDVDTWMMFKWVFKTFMAVVAAYHAAIEKLQNRATVEAPATEKPSIKEQLEAGAKQAGKEASEQTAPTKQKKAAKEER